MNRSKPPVRLIKPKYHVSWLIGAAFLFILATMYGIVVYKESLNIFIVGAFLYISGTVFGLLFLSNTSFSLTPHFYIRKHTVTQAIKEHTVYQRLDNISISFHKDKLHAEAFPAVFNGFIIDGTALFEGTLSTRDPAFNNAKFKSYDNEEQYWVWGQQVPKNKFPEYTCDQLKMAKLIQDF